MTFEGLKFEITNADYLNAQYERSLEETACKTLKMRTTTRKNFLLPSVFQFVELNTELIATETSCPGEIVCGQLLEKRVCFYLSLSLLNETPKGQSSQLRLLRT